MATLAQYSATLHEHEAQAAPTPRPGVGTNVVGAAIYAAVFALVAIAGLIQAG